MHKQIVKYCHLPWQDQALLVYTFGLLGMVRLAILCIPFRFIASCLGQHSKASPAADGRDREYIRRIGWAIELISRYTPWESKCLVQAITAKILLRRRRLKNTLFLGVAKKEDNGLIAHAWICCGEIMVTGGYVCDNFAVVGQFADGYGDHV